MKLKDFFKIDKNPKKGLIPLEIVLIAYIVFTTIVFLIFQSDIPNPSAIISLRVQATAMMFGLWIVYRCIPCHFTFMMRCVLQMALLGSWYPDIYEINRIFPNLDHIFANLEQGIFGCQPALLFYQNFSHPVISELLDMGYVSYYIIMFVVVFYYFFRKYDEFEKTAFIFFTSFFASYVIFLFLSVAGPQYYYPAVGLDKIAAGEFPNIGHYFLNSQDCMPIEGWKDGFFYHLLILAHNAGERPIAAFPSSHVSVTVCMVILAFRGNKTLGSVLLFFFILLCFGTVYVHAHYAIDAIVGIFWGVAVYYICLRLWNLLR